MRSNCQPIWPVAPVTSNFMAVSSAAFAGNLSQPRKLLILGRHVGSDVSHAIPSAGSLHRTPRSSLRIVVVAALVEEIGGLGAHHIPVGEAPRNVNCSLVLRRQGHPAPIAQSRGAQPHIDSNIEDFSRNHAAQFGLGLPQLVMHPAAHRATSANGCPAQSGRECRPAPALRRDRFP